MSKCSAVKKTNTVKLEIKEASKQDRGRGIVRIDPNVFTNLKLRNGDVIQIYHPINKRFTAGILYPSKIEDQGTNSIRLDPFIKRNLQANLGDNVEINRIYPVLAEGVLFNTSEIKIVLHYSQILAKKFQNRVMCVGDMLFFYYYGNRIDLEVVEFIPQAKVVRIHENTLIHCQEINSK